MLKDLFKKNNNSESNNLKEKIANSLMDGYVDIKAYRYNDKNEKKLVYHDTGDNTVTNWMRHVIMQLLAGVPLSINGSGFNEQISDSACNNDNCTTYSSANHSELKNLDGCCISDADYQYLHNSQGVVTNYIALDGHNYPLFPTKVLLGTGKEYTSWENLQEENEQNNATWYSEMVEGYGSGEGEASAKDQVNNLIEGQSICCNTYSATVGAQNVYSGNGSLVPAITVNDPDPAVLEESPANLANRYGVVGAIKTAYLPDGSDIGGFILEPSGSTRVTVNELLNPTVSDSGKLLKSRYRGVGRPCFIYFNRTRTSAEEGYKLDYSKQTSGVYLSKENKTSIPYLNRITFRVVMPAQRGSDSNGSYYPYNGYTLKQVGLFNDALISIQEGVPNSSLWPKMPCGMMLAVKNIASFTKTADEEINFTWTLTI